MIKLIDNIKDDINAIHEDWDSLKDEIKITFPDGTSSNLSKEARIYAMDYITVFMRTLLKNKFIELPMEIFPAYHEITDKLARMYYLIDKNLPYQENFAFNAMEVLSFINTSEKYAVLLEGCQHPANQNIYLNSKKMAGGGGDAASDGANTLQNSHKFSEKLV
jgi:hypothetical protein